MAEKSPKRSTETMCRAVANVRGYRPNRGAVVEQVAPSSEHSPRPQVTQRRGPDLPVKALGKSRARQTNAFRKLFHVPNTARLTMDQLEARCNDRICESAHESRL